MTVIIFILILSVLVFVHELGHFLVAKKAGVRVDEFGFGYPPRATVLGKKWGTTFTLNWIPFGGFVKILGEDYEEQNVAANDSFRSQDVSHISLQEHLLPQKPDRSFTQVSKKWQTAILAAGVAFNIIFAWLIFSLGFLVGLPSSVENDYGAEAKNPALTVVEVLPDSLAKIAGIKSGDKIISIATTKKESKDLMPEDVSALISGASGEITLQIKRGKEVLDFKIMPQENIEAKKIIGVSMDMIGTVSLPLHEALYEGLRTTVEISYLTVEGVIGLIKNAFLGKADISQVTGPVGIVGMVGDASRLGFAYLLTFTALISINLAIINLLPFPALDGGRIIFVAVEAIMKKPINPKVVQTLNSVGFALLIALMIFITYRDILKLF